MKVEFKWTVGHALKTLKKSLLPALPLYATGILLCFIMEDVECRAAANSYTAGYNHAMEEWKENKVTDA